MTIPFGKYKGMTVEALAKLEQGRDYLNWLYDRLEEELVEKTKLKEEIERVSGMNTEDAEDNPF